MCESGDVLAEFDASALLTTIEAFIRIAGRQSLSSTGGTTTSTKPTAKPPPPPPPVRSSSNPGYAAGGMGHSPSPQHLHGSQQVNNNITKPSEDSPKRTLPSSLFTNVTSENSPAIGTNPEPKPIAVVGPVAVTGLGAVVRTTEAASRNESPVSTSEDISNLENLESDPLDVRLSSSKASTPPPQPEDSMIAGLNCRNIEDEAPTRESNTTYRSVPGDLGSQGPGKKTTVEVLSNEGDDAVKSAKDAVRETRRLQRGGTLTSSGGDPPERQDEGTNASVRKLRSLFENSKGGAGAGDAPSEQRGKPLSNQKPSRDNKPVEGNPETVDSTATANNGGGRDGRPVVDKANESFFTTNVKAAIVAIIASLILYLYIYHPYILMLVIIVAAILLYKFVFASGSKATVGSDEAARPSGSQTEKRKTGINSTTETSKESVGTESKE